MRARLELTAGALAEGIVRVANANMERAIRVVSVERGHDPREFALLAFGGAGGMHACELARELGMRRSSCRGTPACCRRSGMLMADVTRDYSASVLVAARRASAGGADAPVRCRSSPARARELDAEGFAPAPAAARALRRRPLRRPVVRDHGAVGARLSPRLRSGARARIRLRGSRSRPIEVVRPARARRRRAREADAARLRRAAGDHAQAGPVRPGRFGGRSVARAFYR